MGIVRNRSTVTLTVTGGYNISPPCYVTVWYGCYRNSYAKRGAATAVNIICTTCCPKCYVLGVTAILIVRMHARFLGLAMMVYIICNTCVPDIILHELGYNNA